MHYDQLSNKLFGGRRDSQALQEIDIAPEKAGSWRVEEEFIGAIRGEEEILLTDFATAVKYMEFYRRGAQECGLRSADSCSRVGFHLALRA